MKNQDMTPQTLVRRVRSGEAKTRSDWAKEFGKSINYIDHMLGRLRKHNIMLYPVGTGFHTEGIIKEVVKRSRDYRETSERMSKTFINPHVISGFRLRENYLLEDPSRRAEVEMTATEFVQMVEAHKQRLLTGK